MIRILDPLMFDMLDPSIRRVISVRQLHGKDIQGFTYLRAFDLRYIHHILDLLLVVVRFGGQGFARMSQNTLISKSCHPTLVSRIQSCS